MSDASAVPTVQSLLARLEERDARIELLLVQLAERDALITDLKTEIDTLKAKVATLEGRLKKNSQNSSKPPSTDAFVKPPQRSLRRSSGKSPGKQTGEPGMRLQPAQSPDAVLIHEPGQCGNCGLVLSDALLAGERSRQLFDLAPIGLEVIEHRVRIRRCSCGEFTEAIFSPEVTASTCYGPRIQGLGAYLMDRRHLPVARTAELLADAFGAPVSTGWLASLQLRAAKLLTPFLDAVRERVRRAPVAHFDEAGARVAGSLAWVHVTCTGELTVLYLGPGRGRESIEAGGILGAGFNGVSVHDGLPAYRAYPVQHGLCNAHHLRERTGIAAAGGQQWALPGWPVFWGKCWWPSTKPRPPGQPV